MILISMVGSRDNNIVWPRNQQLVAKAQRLWFCCNDLGHALPAMRAKQSSPEKCAIPHSPDFYLGK